MPPSICRTCGVQQASSPTPPGRCPICEDPRQYVGWEGQRWATLDELREEGHRTVVRPEEDGLLGIGVEPQVGIGQRSLLVVGPRGNLLWDVPGFVDDDALQAAADQGGVAAVSASHPHFYGVMGEWARAFDAPILLPEADREWIPRHDVRLELYRDRVEPVPGVTLVRTGGHFPGSAVAHWPAGAGGRGALLTGDSVAVAQDRRWVSFMWSYPNMIPLDRGRLDGIFAALKGLAFDRIYGGWWGRMVSEGGREAVLRSVERYRLAISDTSALER